jgi:hypothetical protein
MTILQQDNNSLTEVLTDKICSLLTNEERRRVRVRAQIVLHDKVRQNHSVDL